jgi:O-antigen ligase
VILYFIFLFLVPFQEHPILGAQLFSVGGLPVTPIKLVGIPLVAFALLLPRPRDAVARPGTGILSLFAAFAIFQVLGTILSSLNFPANDTSTLFAFAILMFTTNLLINTKDRLQMTIRVIVLAEAFASTWMYKQYYIYHWPRPIGPSSDPNYEALSLVMTVPLAIWLTRYEVGNLWKWVGRICAPMLAYAVFLSQSRGGLLALAVMATLAWLNSRHKMKLLAGFIAAALLLFAIAPTQVVDRINQIRISGEAETGAELSTRTRVELAKAGIGMMEAHPLFGIGLDQFKAVEFHYNPLLEDLIPFPKIAHDTYIQLGAEGGIPTLTFFLAILLLTLANCRACRKLPGVPAETAALAWSFEVGLIGTMVAQLFISAEYIKEVWVFISLAPNLYAISLHLAREASAKAVPAQPRPVTPIVVKPRLRRAG